MAKRERLNTLRRLHIVSALIFTALAVLAGIMMKPTSYAFVISHATKDELASQTTTIFAPAIHHIIDVDMRVAAIALMLLGVLTAILAVSKWRTTYEKLLGIRQSPLTWLSLGGILPALMVEVIAMFNGVQDVLFLKMLAGGTLLAGAFAYLAERDNRGARRPRWLFVRLSLISAVIVWLFLAAMLVATPVYGVVRLPWFVYGLFAVLTLASLAAFANLVYELRNKSGAKDFAVIERNYLLINLLAKSSFVVLLIIGLKK